MSKKKIVYIALVLALIIAGLLSPLWIWVEGPWSAARPLLDAWAHQRVDALALKQGWALPEESADRMARCLAAREQGDLEASGCPYRFNRFIADEEIAPKLKADPCLKAKGGHAKRRARAFKACLRAHLPDDWAVARPGSIEASAKQLMELKQLSPAAAREAAACFADRMFARFEAERCPLINPDRSADAPLLLSEMDCVMRYGLEGAYREAQRACGVE